MKPRWLDRRSGLFTASARFPRELFESKLRDDYDKNAIRVVNACAAEDIKISLRDE